MSRKIFFEFPHATYRLYGGFGTVIYPVSVSPVISGSDWLVAIGSKGGVTLGEGKGDLEQSSQLWQE